VKLLNYFRNYMKEHLLKAGANMEVFPLSTPHPLTPPLTPPHSPS